MRAPWIVLVGVVVVVVVIVIVDVIVVVVGRRFDDDDDDDDDYDDDYDYDYAYEYDADGSPCPDPNGRPIIPVPPDARRHGKSVRESMPAPTPETRSEPTFGQVAVRHRFASVEQVNECIQVQNDERARGENPRFLGEIMVEKGYLTPEKVQEVMRLRAQQNSLPAFQIPGYELMAKLGQGGMGAVFKARQVSMDRLVALKLLPQRLQSNRGFIERFYQEARAAGRLNHENIVRAFDVGEANGVHFFSMEFVDGENVQSILRRDKRLDEKKALDVTLQIARALEHAHKNNLVHRDVKPENIMITKEGVAKLCDLGLAKDTSGDSSLTQAGTCVGTPHYIAPEQARGEHDIDIRADIYSLGASLYHMVIGEPVFNGPSPAVVMTKHLTEPVPDPRTIRPELSEGTAHVILKAMEKQRERRYQSPEEMIADLEKAIAGEPVAPRAAPGPVPRAGGTRRMKDTSHARLDGYGPTRVVRNPAGGPGVMIAAVAVLAIAVLAGVLAMRKKEEAPPQTPPAKPVASTPVVPPPVSPPAATQAQEDRAKDALAVVETFRKENGADPKKVADVVGMYEEFLKREEFKLTRWWLEADKGLKEYRAEVEQMAVNALEPIRKEAEALKAQEKFLDAAKAYDKFPFELQKTDAWAKALAEVGGLTRQARDRIDQGLRNAEELASSFKFDEARALLNSLLAGADPQQTEAIQKKQKEVADAAQAFDAQMRAKSVVAYDDLRKVENRALFKRDFAEARGAVEKAQKDPVLRSHADTLALDLEEIGLYEAVFSDADKGARKLARANQPVTLRRTAGPANVVIENGEVSFRAGPATIRIDFRTLEPDDLEKLASQALDSSAESQLKIALLWFYAFNPDKQIDAKGEEYKRAREVLETIVKKVTRVERYVRWLTEAANASVVKEAMDLFAKAKEDVDGKRWPEAFKELNSLLKTYGDTSFVRDRKTDIDDLLKKASENLAGEPRALDKLFSVKPKTLNEKGVIDITYDWSKDDQLKDWEAFAFPVDPRNEPKGEWWIEGKELVARGNKYYYWKPKLKGDLAVEFVLDSRECRNLGLQICDDQRGKSYRVALGYELQVPDQRLLRLLRMQPVSIVRLDLEALTKLQNGGDPQAAGPRIWEQAHHVLRGEAAPRLEKKRYRVIVYRKGDEIGLEVDGSVVAHAADTAYTGGQIALWCDYQPDDPKAICGGFAHVHIQGILDPEWIKSPGK